MYIWLHTQTNISLNQFTITVENDDFTSKRYHLKLQCNFHIFNYKWRFLVLGVKTRFSIFVFPFDLIAISIRNGQVFLKFSPYSASWETSLALEVFCWVVVAFLATLSCVCTVLNKNRSKSWSSGEVLESRVLMISLLKSWVVS